MPEIHDPMSATLEALRSDVERTPLADSLAVRRRGDRRTRHQAIGAALTVVALVAGALGLAGGLTGDDESLKGPPANPKSDANAFLLTVDQLPDPEFWAQFGTWKQLGQGDEPVFTPLQRSCLPVGVLGGRTPDATRQFRSGPPSGPHTGISEDVYALTPGDGPPASVVESVKTGLRSCQQSHTGEVGEQSAITALDAVPGGWLFNRSYDGLEGAKGIDLVAVGAAGRHLVVLSLESPGIQDVAPTAGMASALEQALNGRDSGGESGTPVTDVPETALMTLDDLGVTGMAKLDGGAAIETLNPCLLGSDDAVSVGHVVYGPQTDDIAASQVIITQSDETGAANQLAGFASEMSACEQRLARGPTAGWAVTVTPLDLTPAQQGALGQKAWGFRIRADKPATGSTAAETSRVYAIGFRTRNVTAVLAFRYPEFAIAERTIGTALAARDRMVATYGS